MIIPHDKAIVLYNAHNQQKIGVFKAPALAARYLFDGNYKYNLSSTVARAAMRNGCILKTRFEFKVAVRYAKGEDETLVFSENFVILNNYPAPTKSEMKGFNDSAESYSMEFKRRIGNYHSEQARVKENNRFI